MCGLSPCTLRHLVSVARPSLMLVSLVAALSAQAQQEPSQGIYTCTDARGRKLTADRPIPDCTDREQKLLNPSGTVKARLGPSLTQQERADLEAKLKLELEERARLTEEKRRERALLIRYPNKSVHDKERAEALAQIGVIRQAALTRTQELLRQRIEIDREMEFYKKDPSKAPLSLRRQVDDMAQSLAVQARFVTDQEAEFKRVSSRFDAELIRLKQLWALQSPGAPTATSKNR